MTQSLTLPSMTNTQMPNNINALSAGIPNYFDAYKEAANLPSKINSWTNSNIKRQRATGDQISRLMGQVAEQRAGSGIMGGTEDQNRLSNTLTGLNKVILDNQNNIMNQSTALKTNAIQSLPSMSMLPVNAMTNLYSLNSGDQHFWADLAARLINMGY